MLLQSAMGERTDSPAFNLCKKGASQISRKAESWPRAIESQGRGPEAGIETYLKVLYCGSSNRREDRRRPQMAKVVSCRDVGVDCDFVAKGETEQDILQQCTEHARSAHNMTEIPAELVDKVRDAIRDEAA